LKLSEIRSISGFHRGTFSADAKSLALVNGSHIDIVETGRGRTLVSLAQPNPMFLSARFSPDGQLLATAYKRDEAGGQTSLEIALWEVASGREKLTLPVIDRDWRRPVNDLSFSPDGRLLASSVGGIARLWDVASGKEMRRFVPAAHEEVEAERVLLSPDSRWLAVYFRSAKEQADGTLRVWDVETGQQKTFATEIYSDWRFSNDSKLLAVAAIADKGKRGERSVAEIWDVGAGRRLKVIEPPHEWRGAYTVAFSPDSKLLAIGGYKKFGIFSIDSGELLVQETHHHPGLLQDSEIPNQLDHVEFSNDGNLLLTSGNDNTVKLWRVETK
jgi:WD40 repeat protein